LCCGLLMTHSDCTGCPSCVAFAYPKSLSFAANVTLFTKPKVHNVSQNGCVFACCLFVLLCSSTDVNVFISEEGRATATGSMHRKNLGEVWMCGFWDMPAGGQTDRQTCSTFCSPGCMVSWSWTSTAMLICSTRRSSESWTLGQLSLASLRGRLIEYQLRLG